MTEIGITTLMLILANIFCSVQGLNDHPSIERYNFGIKTILLQKDYKRLLTSGFFHVSWFHLLLNIASLCFFSGGIELELGAPKFLLIYFAGLLGGNFFALFIHQDKLKYKTVGSSGAVCGLIFATIALFPKYEIGFFGIHFPIPGWFYGFLFVLVSLYGIKSRRDNLGHEANLAGGLAGLLTAILLVPSALSANYLPILAISIPTIFFISIIITKPHFLLVETSLLKQEVKPPPVERKVILEEVDHQTQIDLILEKIHHSGMESLSTLEKEKLDYYSRIIR